MGEHSTRTQRTLKRLIQTRLANYCSQFIPDFSTITSPLRQLTQKGVKWSWKTAQQIAFDKVKAAISQDCIMAYYDPEKKNSFDCRC